MPVLVLGLQRPTFPASARCWIAPTAILLGDIALEDDVSFWFGAVARADNEKMTIGARSNVQDGAVLHSDRGSPLTVGASCTIGHRAILHGCTISDRVIVGMGATVLNDAVIGENCIIGANALVTQGKRFEPNSLIIGAPARAVRMLSGEEIASIVESADEYVANYRRFASELMESPAAP